MPLPKTTRTEITDYAAAHIPNEEWHVQYFDFVADARLRRQLGKEPSHNYLAIFDEV